MENVIDVGFTFDARQIAPDSGSDPIPAGVYNVEITDTGIRNFKDAAAGWGFNVEFTVLDGVYQGKKVYNLYSVGHKINPETVRIANSQISALCWVTGIFNLVGQGEAIRKARLKIDVTNDGTRNNLKGVMDINGNKPAKTGHGNAPATPVATAAPTPAGAPAGWGSGAGTAPIPPAPPAPPATPPAPTAAPAVPPAGWLPHPSSPGWFYQGQEVLNEAQLRAKYPPLPTPAAAPTVPAAPVAPASPGFAQAPTAGATPPWGPPTA